MIVISWLRLVSFCILLFYKVSSQVSSSIDTVRPKLESVEQVNAQSVRLRWSFNYTSRYLEKYRITYTTNDWQTSDDWPAQMRSAKTVSLSTNQVYLLSKKRLECMNDCIKTVSCLGILSSPADNSNNDDHNCVLQQGVFIDTFECGDKNSIDCANILVYTDTAIVDGIPYGYEYQFRVRVYDSFANKWSLDSDSSRHVDMRLQIATNLTLQYTVKTMLKSASLFLTWKFNNIYEYPISRYIFALSINNSNFITLDNSQFLDNMKFSFVPTDVSYDVSLTKTEIEQDECFRLCYANETCNYISYDKIYKRCSYQTPRPLRASRCPQNRLCGFIKNDAKEFYIDNVKENTNYTVMMIAETYFGAYRVLYNSYKTPMTLNNEILLDKEIRDYIIIGAVVGAVGVLLIIATIIGLCIYHRMKLNRLRNGERSRIYESKDSIVAAPKVVTLVCREVTQTTISREIENESLLSTIELDNVYNAWNEHTADNNRLLIEEFKQVHNPSVLICQEATRAENYNRNRYRDVYPYDFNRVKLKNLNMSENRSDYTNASFIRNLNGDVKFISSQGPSKETVCDFWRMIVEYQIKAIVMLVNIYEDGKLKCFPYWDDDRELDFAPYRVRCVSIKQTQFFIERIFHVTFYREIFMVNHYHYTEWPDTGVPKMTDGINSLIDTINQKHPFSDWPILVHCIAGIGRTGTFIATDLLLESIDKRDKMINLPTHINALRAQRAHMVQTFEQYKFIYQLLLHRYFILITKIDAINAQDTFDELRLTKIENSDETLLQFEYQSLDNDITTRSKHILVAEYPEKFNHRQFIPYDKALVRLPKLGIDLSSQYYDCTMHHDRLSNTIFLLAKSPSQTHSYDFLRLLDAYKPHLVITMDEVSLYPSSKHDTISFHEFKLSANESVRRNKALYYVDSESQTITFKNMKKRDPPHSFIRYNLTKDFNVSDSNVKNEKLLNSIEKILKAYISLKKVMSVRNPVILLQSDDAGDRCAFICSLLILSIQYLKSSQIDVFQTIRKLRHSRTNMISTFQCYEFLYEIIIEFIRRDRTRETSQYDISVLV